METKLTLRLDKDVIDRAKGFARLRNISLSKMIESYLDSVTRMEYAQKAEITPLVQNLSGVIELDKEFDNKREYASHLKNKHK